MFTVIALLFNITSPATLILPTADEAPPVAVNKARAPELKVVDPPMELVDEVELAKVAPDNTVTAEAPMEPPGPKANVAVLLTVVGPE